MKTLGVNQNHPRQIGTQALFTDTVDQIEKDLGLQFTEEKVGLKSWGISRILMDL